MSNKFVSVLKKIGEVFSGKPGTKIQPSVDAYTNLARAVAAITPNTTDDQIVEAEAAITQDGLIRLQSIITDAEVVGQTLGLAGDQKAIMSAQAINQLLMDLPLVKGLKPEDPEQTKADAAAVGAAFAKYLNGFKG